MLVLNRSEECNYVERKDLRWSVGNQSHGVRVDSDDWQRKVMMRNAKYKLKFVL